MSHCIILHFKPLAEIPVWQGVAVAIPCYTRNISTSYTRLLFSSNILYIISMNRGLEFCLA